MNKLKRYLSFLVGLFVNALGVSLITKASLGTSPISSIPYVLSLNFPLTLGNFTILFSLLLIVLQLIILRKDFKPEHILQIPVSIAFGYFIDLTMYLFFWVNPQNYLVKYLPCLWAVWYLDLVFILKYWQTLSCFQVNRSFVWLYKHGTPTSEPQKLSSLLP